MNLQGVPSQRILPTVMPQPVMQAPYVDRTAWAGGGGWKRGKGNSNNDALSALTLLAFLFFLNILQNCLRDTFGQNPGVVMMMVTTTTEAAVRRKREQLDWEEVTTQSPPSHWTESQITNRIHDQIQSYWSSDEERLVSNNGVNHSRLEQNLDNGNNATIKTKHYKESIHSDTNIGQQELKNRISAKLNTIKKSKENYRHQKQYQREYLANKPGHVTLNESTWNQSYSNDGNPQWKTIIGGVFKNSRAYVENKCCGIISNWTKESMYGVGNVNFVNSLMR